MQIIRTKNRKITTSKRASEKVTDALQQVKEYCHYENKEQFVQIVMDGIRDFLLDFAEENDIENPLQFINEALEQSFDRLENPIEVHEVFKIRTADLDLSIRCVNLLRYYGFCHNIETIEDLVRCHAKDLLSERNFGRKSLAEIEQWLASKGLFLGMTDDDILNYKAM